jgi:hypothetical protein
MTDLHTPGDQSYRQRWGYAAAAQSRLIQYLDRFAGLHLFGIYTRPIRESYAATAVPPGVALRLFGKDDAHALLAHARRPELVLTESFVQQALGQGDICTAVLVNDEIVSFDWSAFTPTHVRDGVNVYPGPRYRYGYFAYTLPEFRGRHLPRLTLPMRDRYCIDRGYTRSISYISIDN